MSYNIYNTQNMPARSAQLSPAIGMYQTVEDTETTDNPLMDVVESSTKTVKVSTKRKSTTSRKRKSDEITPDIPPDKVPDTNESVPVLKPKLGEKFLVVKNAVTKQVKEYACIMANADNGTIQTLNEVVQHVLFKAAENAKQRSKSAKPKIMACDFEGIVS